MEFQKFEENIGNKNESITITETELNNKVSDYYRANNHTGVEQIANKFEGDRNALRESLGQEKSNVQSECRDLMCEMRFGLLNDTFGGNQEVMDLYNELKENLDIDLFVLFNEYNAYITNALEFPENGEMTLGDYKNLIENVRTLFVMKVTEVNEKLLELKENNNGSLQGMQWIINGQINQHLEEYRKQVLTSAKFFIDMKNPEFKQNLSDKIGKLHVNMREREISEALVEKKLVVYKDEGIFDFAEENDFMREVDEIPTDIIGNDSFFTADKVRNTYKDNFIYTQDYGNGAMKEAIDPLKEVSVLNEKDKQTEMEYLISGLVYELLLCIPVVGGAGSLANIFTGEDMSVEAIQHFRPDLDPSYKPDYTMYDRFQDVILLVLGLVGARALGKSVDFKTAFQKIANIGAPQEVIQRSMTKAAKSIGVDMNTVSKFFQLENKSHKETSNVVHAQDSLKHGDILESQFMGNVDNQLSTPDYLRRNYGLTQKEVIQNAQLNDTQRLEKIAELFPGLTEKQREVVLQTHHMQGELFHHTQGEKIAKMRHLIEKGGIEKEAAQTIMDMGLAGKINSIQTSHKLDTQGLLDTIASDKLDKVLTKDKFQIIQEGRTVFGEYGGPKTFQRDIKIGKETFMTIVGDSKEVLDYIAGAARVVKKQTMDFQEIYDSASKTQGGKVVDTYKDKKLSGAFHSFQTS